MRKFALCALGMVCLFWPCASAALGSDSQQALTWQFPASGVILGNVHSEPRSDYDPATHEVGPVYFIDCAIITNASGTALESVELAFALMGHDGSRIGRVLTYDVPPSEIPTEGSTRSVCLKNGYAGGVRGQVLVGWVDEVVSADGLIWSVAPPIAASPSSQKIFGVRLSKSEVLLPDESCTDFKNASGKEISHVQLVFVYVTGTGTVIHKDALDVRRSLPDGQSWRNLCRRFAGSTDPDVFYYAELRSRGFSNLPAPEMFYDGQKVSLIVRITQVAFSDGSKFRAELP